MKNRLSMLVSELSSMLETSLVLNKYPRPRTKIIFSFLKFADDSIQSFFITVYIKKKNYFIVFDSTIYCYAFYDGFIPKNVRLMIWGRVFHGKWLEIIEWKIISEKKFCFDFF